MEINIKIEKNDYVQDTQIREDVVQGICDAFLSDNCHNIFHPFSNGYHRNPKTMIVRHKKNCKYYGFMDHVYDDEDGVKFNTSEMRTAFQALIRAGYHMFKFYEYGEWMGYKCSKKPFIENGVEVFEYNDFID